MEKSYKYRIYPNKTQKQILTQTFGCVRFVYNHYLDKRIKTYEKDKTTLGYTKCSSDLTNLKKQVRPVYRMTWFYEAGISHF
ncbi:helix-turn-helix domain-containing protein [Hungatella hathewayi]|uniref:helix-turn-helix domain-containing protein n=1 Tax=Hungatella hathewayi TaxID=154046 RepID=UPI003567ED0C